MPILASNTMEFFSHSPEQTRRLGIRLGALLQPGDVVALSGDLGSGKTTLVQGIAQGWGSLDRVSSPTFVLINQYRRPDGALLSHLDAYRLSDEAEAEDLDLGLNLSQGALVVEWAERIQGILPVNLLTISMRWVDEFQRGMALVPRGKHYEQILKELSRHTFGNR